MRMVMVMIGSTSRLLHWRRGTRREIQKTPKNQRDLRERARRPKASLPGQRQVDQNLVVSKPLLTEPHMVQPPPPNLGSSILSNRTTFPNPKALSSRNLESVVLDKFGTYLLYVIEYLWFRSPASAKVRRRHGVGCLRPFQTRVARGRTTCSTNKRETLRPNEKRIYYTETRKYKLCSTNKNTIKKPFKIR